MESPGVKYNEAGSVLFGSDRSSVSYCVCLSVCMAESCSEQLILIFQLRIFMMASGFRILGFEIKLRVFLLEELHSRDCALDRAGILLSWPRRLEIKLTTCGLSRCPCHTFFIVLGDGDDDAAEDDIESLHDAGVDKDINEDTGKCDAAEDTNKDLGVGEATVVNDDVLSEEIAVADDGAEAAVSVHDLDKDEFKWDDHEGVLSDVVIIHVFVILIF